MKNKKIFKGFVWGVVATVVMSIIMILGKISGLSPIPKPIPVAIVVRVFGKLPVPALMTLAIILHLAYGGFWSAILSHFKNDISILDGIWLGIALWLLMQIIVLPYLGWGLFGIEFTGMPPKIAIGTFILHIVYGFVVGFGMSTRTGIA